MTHTNTLKYLQKETLPWIPLIHEAVHRATFWDRYVMKYSEAFTIFLSNCKAAWKIS